MIDDYSYSPRELPPKNSELLGLGGRPNEGSRGFGGTLIDSGSVGVSGDGGGGLDGRNGDPGQDGLTGATGPNGGTGATGATGFLIDGQQGDMAYHNGSSWVTFAGTSFPALLLGENLSPSWFRPTETGILTSNTQTTEFSILPNASNSILKTDNSNQLIWQYFPDGNTFGDMLFWNGANWAIVPAASGSGISVLASNGGTPYWIETESCDTPP